MSHLVESMAYVGAMPWHKLGNSLEKGQSLDTWAEQAGLNWEINKSPVLFNKDNEGQSPQGNFNDKSVLYRSDTGAPLSVVSQRYNVVQPREILDFYKDLTEISGFELETAGVLKGGKKIWALARTGQSTSLKGNDITNGYVLLATACDGSMATTAQFTSVRVVCNNTLAVSLFQEKENAIKIPHSTRFDAKAVKKSLGISVSAWDDFMYQMKILSERPVSLREARDFYHAVFSSTQTTGKTNERSMAKAIGLFEGNGRGSQLASSKNTAFGLLNSITEFVDHEKRAKSADHRMDSAWFGQGASVKSKALNHAFALVA
jgi:phage/plasmid-like protein (TIGR03299 family)